MPRKPPLESTPLGITHGYLARRKRFDMPGFRPNRFYQREMQNFGILPRPVPKGYQFDVYELDQQYWRSCRE
jgi:hypothetical protein